MSTSTPTSPRTAVPAPSAHTAPSPPSAPSDRGRTVLVALVVVAILGVVIVAVLRGAYRDEPFDPSSPTPQGTRALAQVLQDGGVDVEVARTTSDAAADLRAGRTVLSPDTDLLSARQLDHLATALQDPAAGTLVLVGPQSPEVLESLAPGTTTARTIEADTLSLQADDRCGDLAHRANQIDAGGTADLGPGVLYRTTDTGGATDPADSCFREGDAAAVVRAGDVVILGSPRLVTNEGIGRADNAALALNLLGAEGEVTWFLPSLTDPMADLPATFIDQIPAWVLPTVLWTLLCGVLLLLALGHRLGPVVIEPLPLSVRAQELTVGRAQLLRRARARDAAAQSLRSAAATRIARTLGVRREESLEALIAAIGAHLAGRSPATTPGSDANADTRPAEHARRLLGPTPLGSEDELVRLAHDLDLLEKEIDR